MDKKNIISELKSKSGKSISECLNAFNLTNNIEDAFQILLADEICQIKKITNNKDEKLISKALTISMNNIDGAVSILTHGYDIYSKDKTKYPEFLSEKQKYKKFDDASWHYGGKFPKELPNKNGATHIGMFLNWCIGNNLISKELIDEAKDEIEQIKCQKLTGAEFLIDVCDEKLVTDDLNETGNEFALDYYDDDTEFGKKFNSYTDDYSEVFNKKAEQNGFEYESFYHVEDSFDNYNLLKNIIDKRFEEWKQYRNKTYS
ncbi:hypothetical protein [uncultured Flavobacterium sp.]|uniref:DUF7832 domain-containing protein n=1 Tax=uncultured Flavobacterium sp. TaxID=165435 RepID=UPI0025CD84CF|nr:hypothetical protein [uncultured Flavobacterium sp.]